MNHVGLVPIDNPKYEKFKMPVIHSNLRKFSRIPHFREQYYGYKIRPLEKLVLVSADNLT